MRTFIAIEIEPPIKDKISSLVQELGKAGVKVGWVKKESIHLTLKFLGEIEEKKIKEVSEKLKLISSKIKPFRIRIEGTGWFPEKGSNPRVLWIGVKYPEQLKILWEEIEKELEKTGFRKEVREFSPHITIGRVKGNGSVHKVLEIFKKSITYLFGEMEVKRITLFQSILKPDGAEYIPLEKFDFR